MTPPAPGVDPPPVAAARRVVAAFDFDGTLTTGGSTWQFLAAVRGRRPVAAAAASLSGPLLAAAVLGGHRADDAKEALFRRTLGGLDAADLARRGRDFGRDHYARHARTDVRRRLEWHRRQGHRLVIVSASLDDYVRAVGDELAVDAVIATRLQVGPDGRLTGNYDGGNCRGPQKIARLRQWMADTRGGPTALSPGSGPAPPTAATAIADVLWAYGNSDGDRLLLAGADVGVDVGRLGRLGALRRFHRLSEFAGETDDRHQLRRK